MSGILFASTLAGISVAQSPFQPREPLVDMQQWKANTGLDWRTLDCWECAQSNGKICHDNNYVSMTAVTGSRAAGDQVCCLPEFEGEHCNSEADHTCSQPFYNDDSSSPFYPIVDSSFQNHQLFAFCTQTNQQTCGISSDNSTKDMSLLAGPELTTIQTTEMGYLKGRPSEAKYGACFYEIYSKDESELREEDKEKIRMPGVEDFDAIELQVKVTKADGLNVYLYGGKSRFDAQIPVIDDNQPVEVGEAYTIDMSTGFFLVAYPTDGSPTDFEFSYGLVGYHLPPPPEVVVVVEQKSAEEIMMEQLAQEKAEKNAGYALSIIAVILVAIFGVSVCCICRRKSDEVQILNEDQNGLDHNLGTLSPRPPKEGNDTSMHIDDMEGDEVPNGLEPQQAEFDNKEEEDLDKKEDSNRELIGQDPAVQEGGQIE